MGFTICTSTALSMKVLGPTSTQNLQKLSLATIIIDVLRKIRVRGPDE